MPEDQKAFLVGINPLSFRAGKPAEITGVVFVAPLPLAPRACYLIQFEDGARDLVALHDTQNFKIISGEDVRMGRIPKVLG